jgi:hypothetical protein
MKTSLLLAFGLLLAGFCSLSAESGVPPGTINFTNSEVSQILEIYRGMTGLALVIDSRVKTMHHPITLQAKAAAKDEAEKLIEKALVDQAGVVITRLDDKRASVTYNDALPITQAKKAPKGN